MNGQGYTVKGFLFMTKRRHFTDPALYGDWVGITFPRTVMREELYMGRLPQGLLVEGPKGCEVVVGPTGQRNQKLSPLEEVLGNGSVKKKKPANPRQDKAREIAAHLKELREVLGMTQRELAFHLGLSQLTICQIEGGYRRFRLSTAEKLLKLQSLYEELKVG